MKVVKMLKNCESWVITIPVAGLAAIYLFCLFLPGNKKNEALAEQLQTKQKFLAESLEIEAAVFVLEQKLDSTQTENVAWGQHALENSEIASLFGQVATLARKSGVIVSQFTPQPVEVYSKICRTPAKLICSGTFVEISSFLGELESTPTTIWIDFLQIKKSKAHEELVDCEITIVEFDGHPDNSDHGNLDE